MTIDQPGFLHLPELLPGQGVGGIGDGGRVDKEGDRNLEFLEQRKGLGVNRAMPVIDGDDHRTRRRRRRLAELKVHQLPQGDDVVAIVPQIFQAGGKIGGRDGHAVGDDRAEAVIEQDGNRGGACRFGAGGQGRRSRKRGGQGHDQSDNCRTYEHHGFCLSKGESSKPLQIRS